MESTEIASGTGTGAGTGRLDGAAPAPALPRTLTDAELDARVAVLDLEQKVRLLTGATTWSLPAEPAIGLRPVVMSDGPVGVRGTGEDPRATSVLLPCPTALAATWDPDLARATGGLFAVEARRHGVDVVLAPLLNLQRTPVAGRHFESLSEDPLLTARVGTAFIQGVQGGGVGVCVKHFVANNSETARDRCTAVIPEAVLRQTDMAAFEDAVRRAAPTAIMAAYNGVDDGTQCAPMTEHRHLLVDVLKDQWGFDGPVVSDWTAARSTAASANGGLDIVMPGPDGPWGAALVAAVRAGDVAESTVDEHVRRVLILADRVGALRPGGSGRPADGTPRSAAAPFPEPIDEDGRGAPTPRAPADGALPRRVAAAGTVVLRTDGARLPAAADAPPRRIALIGPNAVRPFYQGGGSAHVTPDRLVAPAQGLARAFPGARIDVVAGVDGAVHAPDLDPERLRVPGTGRAGVLVTQLDAGGAVLSGPEERAWTGTAPDLRPGAETIRVEAEVDLPEPGTHRIGLGHVGTRRLTLGGRTVEDVHRVVSDEVIMDSSLDHPVTAMHPLAGGRAVPMAAEFSVVHSLWGDVARAFLRHRVPGPGEDEGIARAAAAARAADLTVVLVGTNADVESEGWDRTGLDLPGRQDELVDAVLDADPEAVVVVNAGGPVLLPWLDRARTALWMWLPGQDFGDALGDILSGAEEPAGRLPWTLPRRWEDTPVPDAIPDGAGRVVLSEGLDVGYRSYAGPWSGSGGLSPDEGARAARPVPALPFGHGLGWTTWAYSGLALAGPAADGSVDVAVTVTNTGPRRGRETVQVYASRRSGGAGGDPEGSPAGALPSFWLAGFASVELDPGAGEEVTIRIPERSFQTWTAEAGWTRVPGTYEVAVGRSAADIRLTGRVAQAPAG